MDDQQQNIFREAMEKALFKSDSEKTRFDKLMGRDEMIRLKQIFTKPLLSIEDVNEIQNTIISSEIKLTDFRRNERYINHKYYIVIGEYATRYCKAIRADQQYQEEIERQEREIEQEQDIEKKAKRIKLLQDIRNVRAEIQKDYAVMYKKLVNAYLFGVRSPLSFEGNLINLLGTERKEYSYEGNLSPVPQQQILQEKKGVV